MAALHPNPNNGTSTSWKHFFLSIGLLLLVSAKTGAFIRRPNAGLMKLCPPGGESFAAAWEITCGMRRKKRSLTENQETNVDEYGPEGHSIRKSMADDRNWNIDRQLETKRGNVEFKASKLIDEKAKQYRAPSMTEMMLFCCRFGCSLRDLMPYCDPFGEWDS